MIRHLACHGVVYLRTMSALTRLCGLRAVALVADTLCLYHNTELLVAMDKAQVGTHTHTHAHALAHSNTRTHKCYSLVDGLPRATAWLMASGRHTHHDQLTNHPPTHPPTNHPPPYQPTNQPTNQPSNCPCPPWHAPPPPPCPPQV